MNITQQLCCPGAAENQDYIRLGENIAMVVDGSTPLVKDPRVPEVREYVRLLADAVVGAEGEDLPHMVAAGIETLRRRCGVPSGRSDRDPRHPASARRCRKAAACPEVISDPAVWLHGIPARLRARRGRVRL